MRAVVSALHAGKVRAGCGNFKQSNKGETTLSDIDLLEDVTKQIEGHTICAFGEGSSWPVQGLLRHLEKKLTKM